MSTPPALITSMPNRQPTGRFDFNADGLPPLDPFNMQTSEIRMATEGFFEAMGIPLRGTLVQRRRPPRRQSRS